MPFTAALSTLSDSQQALDEVCTRALGELSDTPDLALLFCSPHHSEEAERLAAAAQRRLGARCLLGCTGESIVGNDEEIEQKPALSLWLGRWAKPVGIEAFHLTVEQTSDGHSLLGWPDGLTDLDPAQAVLLLLGDPFTFPVDHFLLEMNRNHAGLRVVGGMASGGWGPGQNRLIINEKATDSGAVGVLLQGPLALRSVVSQGCRPIGQPLVITRAHENQILEMGGKPSLQQLQALWEGLTPEVQQLVQKGLHIGRVINEYQGKFRHGDFLVRNVVGVDQSSGALVITERVRPGQTVQFHVRDAASADEDLRTLLQQDREQHPQPPRGALLFSCNGRGSRLFSEPSHDARAIRGAVGAVPLAGFFAQGELGPVGGQNFIHGFTASVVLFEE